MGDAGGISTGKAVTETWAAVGFVTGINAVRYAVADDFGGDTYAIGRTLPAARIGSTSDFIFAGKAVVLCVADPFRRDALAVTADKATGGCTAMHLIFAVGAIQVTVALPFEGNTRPISAEECDAVTGDARDTL